MSNSSVQQAASPLDWIRVRDGVRIESSGPFRRVFYTHRIPPECSGTFREMEGTVLFISDLHFSGKKSHTFFPGSCCYTLRGNLLEFLQETIQRFQVKHLLFGGDLLQYLCYLDQVLAFFRELRVPGRKFGVYGNWDLKFPWISYHYWETRLREEAGLEILCNRAVDLDGIRLYGMDEYRNGAAFYTPPENRTAPGWILTHNPDAVPAAIGTNDLSHGDLILCGHTHGGQIRLPLFGAVQTSSVHWKHFEYGLYRHRKNRAEMLVTAGLGTTMIHHRIFCPPEAVILNVRQDPAWKYGSTTA